MPVDDDRIAWFAGRLRELREKAGLSRQQLADKAGLKVGGVRNLEQGVREPGWRTVVALADALGVDCRAFLEEPHDMPADRGGRPPKPKEKAEPDKPKRPRGRPRKGGN
jgi:transcriptional regulator with XRE-family HTH domain